MIAANYTTVRNNLKNYCDLATRGTETIIMTRKANEDIVMMSLDRYNKMMKALRNAEYQAKLDRSFEQLDAGKGQLHELIEG